MTDALRPADLASTLARLTALCVPVRRDLYFYVVRRGRWVSRDEAAEAFGLRRGSVARHLDQLADVGLVDVDYQRLTGRSGPGAGRPSKLYRRSDVELVLTIPPRNTALMGRLLAEALAGGGPAAESVRRGLRAVAHEAGREIGANDGAMRSDAERREALVGLLSSYGYEPRSGDGTLRLTNCPYEPIADRQRDLVCNTNLALIAGVVEAVGLSPSNCSLRSPNGGCCVRVAPWAAGSIAALDG